MLGPFSGFNKTLERIQKDPITKLVGTRNANKANEVADSADTTLD